MNVATPNGCPSRATAEPTAKRVTPPENRARFVMETHTRTGAREFHFLGESDRGPRGQLVQEATSLNGSSGLPVRRTAKSWVVGYPETTPKVRVRSETYAAEWISSLRNRIESNCEFGTYRAPATKPS
jgi:hypothetical protein